MSSIQQAPPPPPPVEDAGLYRWLYLLFQYVLGLSGATPSGTFGPPGITTPNDALVPNITRSLDYINLTELSLGGSTVTSTSNEINQLHLSHIQRNSLDNLQSYSGGMHAVSFSVGVEVANVINVSLQAADVAGNNTNIPVSCMAYLSNDPQGLGFTAAAPSGGVAIGSNGFEIDLVAGKVFQLTTNSSGFLDLNITESGTPTWYLCVIMPYSELMISSAITFA